MSMAFLFVCFLGEGCVFAFYSGAPFCWRVPESANNTHTERAMVITTAMLQRRRTFLPPLLLALLLLCCCFATPSHALKANSALNRHHHHPKKKPTPPTITSNNGTSSPLLPKDCKGVPGGTAKKDCLGVCAGKASVDDCGSCTTPERRNKACADCLGEPNGPAREDKCGKCQGKNECLDCHGVPWGKGKLDRCRVCDGDGKSCIGCDGVLHSGKVVDKCNVCGGNNSCVDCEGVAHGFSKRDRCGKCGGQDECVGCDGVPFSGLRKDACDICGGDGSSCSGCDGVPGSKLLWDACGVCAGDNSTCCSPSPFSASSKVPYSNSLKSKLDNLLSSGGGTNNNKKRRRSTQKPQQQKILCHGRGWCDPEIRGCSCDSGWTGPYCQKKQTMCRNGVGDLTVCSGRGSCDSETGLCVCKSGWTGFSCDISLCWGNGAFDPLTQKCFCYAGYAGEFCDRCGNPEDFPRLEYVCVPRSYSLGKFEELAAKPPEKTTDDEAILLEQASRTFDLIALSKSRVTALLYKTKRTERAFKPNSTLENGGFPGTIDCACRVNNTAKDLRLGKGQQQPGSGERKAGATVAAHSMVRDVMAMHAKEVQRSAGQLEAVSDMHQSGSSSLETATNICIAFSTLAWVIVLITMGIVILVGLVFFRAQTGGIAAGFGVLTSGIRFGRQRRRR